MISRTLRNNLFSLCLASMLLPALLQSCSKGTALTTYTPYVDTTGLLTAHSWKVMQFWYDMNNNGRIDSGEIIGGFDFVTVYVFSGNGALRDSTAPYLSKSGTWAYLGGNKATISCKWNDNTLDLHNIMSISDTELVTKREGTDETWYFKR